MGLKTKWNRFWTLRNTEGGFTLVELVIVIAILAILAGVAVPAYNGYVEKAEEAADQVVLGAVNDAFAAACLEYGMDSIDMASAAVRIANQQVGDLAYATHSSVAIDAETRAGMVEAFGRYMEGTDRTVKNDEHQSLVWNNLLKCFEFDTGIALSNGQMVLDSTAVSDIEASLFYGMGVEGVNGLLNENIAEANNLLDLIDIGGDIAGLIGLDFGNQDIVDAVTTGSFARYFTPEQQAQIRYALTDPNATDEEKNEAQNWVANSMFLYTADVLESRDAATLHTTIVNSTASNTREAMSTAVNTGGMGGTLVGTAISSAMYEAFIVSEAGQQYASVSGVEDALKSTDDPDAKNGIWPIQWDRYNAEQQTAMNAYDAWLETEDAKNQLAGFMGALTVIDQNVGSIGQENLITQGTSNADLQTIMGEILPTTSTSTN